MANHHFNRSAAGRWVCCVGGLVLGLVQAQSQIVSDWMNQLRVGGLVGFNINADFTTHGQFSISESKPGPAGVSGVDHLYDDGYVRVDQTGNAQGYTSYWGYENASQYNGANHTLQMHSATSFTTSHSGNNSDAPYVGAELAYTANPWLWGETHLGFEFGFGYLPIQIKDNMQAQASVTRSIYSFDTGGILMPTAPYNGGPSGIGPTIHDIATALPGDTVPGTIGGTQTLEVNLLILRLGPSFYWDLGQHFGASAGAGAAVGIMPGELKYDELITLPDGSTAHNQAQADSTPITFGGYVGGAVMWHAVSHGDIYVSAQFMPMGSKTFDGQGRQARLNLQGQVLISAGVNWPF